MYLWLFYFCLGLTFSPQGDSLTSHTVPGDETNSMALVSGGPMLGSLSKIG